MKKTAALNVDATLNEVAALYALTIAQRDQLSLLMNGWQLHWVRTGVDASTVFTRLHAAAAQIKGAR